MQAAWKMQKLHEQDFPDSKRAWFAASTAQWAVQQQYLAVHYHEMMLRRDHHQCDDGMCHRHRPHHHLHVLSLPVLHRRELARVLGVVVLLLLLLLLSLLLSLLLLLLLPSSAASHSSSVRLQLLRVVMHQGQQMMMRMMMEQEQQLQQQQQQQMGYEYLQ